MDLFTNALMIGLGIGAALYLIPIILSMIALVFVVVAGIVVNVFSKKGE
ncbi:MAG TPA: hypothetical protein VIY48_04425 [Candidatus Paceibacterota bacterium]